MTKMVKVGQRHQQVERHVERGSAFRLGRQVDPEEYAKLEAFHPATGRQILVDASADVATTEDDVRTQLRELSGKFYFYTQLRDVLKSQCRIARAACDAVEEDVYNHVKDSDPNAGSRDAMKETEIKNRVGAAPSVRAARDEVALAEARFERMQSLVDALVERRWDLRAISKLDIAEMMLSGKDTE